MHRTGRVDAYYTAVMFKLLAMFGALEFWGEFQFS